MWECWVGPYEVDKALRTLVNIVVGLYGIHLPSSSFPDFITCEHGGAE